MLVEMIPFFSLVGMFPCCFLAGCSVDLCGLAFSTCALKGGSPELDSQPGLVNVCFGSKYILKYSMVPLTQTKFKGAMAVKTLLK